MNMQRIMQEAQKMQREITKKQEEINGTLYEGKSGNVVVVLNGLKEMISINVDFSNIIDDDDREAVLDMIKLAHNDAIKKINSDVESKLGAYTKGLNGLF